MLGAFAPLGSAAAKDRSELLDRIDPRVTFKCVQLFERDDHAPKRVCAGSPRKPSRRGGYERRKIPGELEALGGCVRTLERSSDRLVPRLKRVGDQRQRDRGAARSALLETEHGSGH